MSRLSLHGTRWLKARFLPLVVSLMASLTISFCSTEPALARITLNKDGLDQAAVADCVIDTPSLQNCTFTKTSNSSFVFVTESGSYTEKENGTSHTRFGVYIDHTPAAGEKTMPGSFELKFANALLDKEGKRHDLYVRFSNVKVRWRADTGTGRVLQHLLQINNTSMRLLAEPGALLKNGASCYEPWKTGTFNALGISCDVTFWNGDSTALKYNLYAQDLDQPDRFTGNGAVDCTFNSAWSESYIPSGDFSSFHVSKDSWLTTDGSRIYGTQGDSDEDLGRSAFVCIGTMGGASSPLQFTWKGSGCSTRILQDWSHRLRIRVIYGTGGTIAASCGTGGPFATNDQDGWSAMGVVPRNDYVVTAHPSEGYYVTGMWLNGTMVSDAEIAAGTVRLNKIAKNNDVSVMFRKIPAKSTVAVRKSSAAEQVSADNPCYELEGATYGVYGDEACTKLLGTLVTDSDGLSDQLELDPGTYYVRETGAPVGFALDDGVHKIELASEQAYTLDVKDTPQLAPVDLVVLKTDRESGTAQPQGGASLAGAEFLVAYYAGRYEADELPDAPTRSWTVSMDDAGRARLAADAIVDGDDLYELDGRIGIPLGTLAITETKAPEGYLLPDDAPTVIHHVTAEPGEAAPNALAAPTEQSPTAADQVIRGGVALKKTAEDGSTPLPGATFAIMGTGGEHVIVDGRTYAAGETCLTIESSEDGIARSEERALPYGSYVAIEQRAPEGYGIDSSWRKEFTVREDGVVVDLTEQPARNARLSTRVALTATKTFDGASQGRTLEDGMFTFELLDSKGSVIQSKTNDAEGQIRFDELPFDSTAAGKRLAYTIREVRGTDEEIVYDGHIEELSIALRVEGDKLVADVETDEDGLAFHNSTVAALSMPLTGMAGVKGALPGAVIALAASGTLLGRRHLRQGQKRRRR